MNIIADKNYLEEKNQEQLSAAKLYIVIALLFWSLIVALIPMLMKKKTYISGSQQAGSDGCPAGEREASQLSLGVGLPILADIRGILTGGGVPNAA